MTLMIAGIVMVVCLILAIGFFIDGAFTAADGDEELADKMASVSGLFLFLTIALIVFIFWAEYHFDNLPYTYSKTPYSSEYIVALKDNSEVNGQFHGGRYCVRGYINEVQYYSYMVKQSDGGKVMNKVPTNGSTIYEVDSDFRVEWYHKTKKWLGMSVEDNYWKIYVPKGSITDDYNVDLE